MPDDRPHVSTESITTDLLFIQTARHRSLAMYDRRQLDEADPVALVNQERETIDEMKKSFFKEKAYRRTHGIRSTFDITYSCIVHKGGRKSAILSIKNHLYDMLTSNNRERVDLLWDEERMEGELVSHPEDGYSMSNSGLSKKLTIPFHTDFGLPWVNSSIECQLIAAKRHSVTFKLNLNGHAVEDDNEE
jgi:hypothetical protein